MTFEFVVHSIKIIHVSYYNWLNSTVCSCSWEWIVNQTFTVYCSLEWIVNQTFTVYCSWEWIVYQTFNVYLCTTCTLYCSKFFNKMTFRGNNNNIQVKGMNTREFYLLSLFNSTKHPLHSPLELNVLTFIKFSSTYP